jgi:hypothetical protein
MQSSKTFVRNIEVKTCRKNRAINIATSIIPLDRDDLVAVDAIFHKSFMGHVLVAINKAHRPVASWCDVVGILPIKSRVVKQNQFVDIIGRLKPKTLYLNNGELLKSILNQYILHIYNDESLIEILQQLSIENPETCDADPNNVCASGNIEKYQINSSSTTMDMTFADMKVLDPTLTRREYTKIMKISKKTKHCHQRK